MEDEQELTKLRGRIAQLESENADLRKSTRTEEVGRRRRRRWLSALSAVLIVISIVVAPIAVLSTWARAQLVDTDRFTSTFAPLAQEESVQGFLSDQVMVAVEENVDIDGLIEGVFVGIGELDLPAEATAALPLLQGPAAEGVRSIIRAGVDRVLASPQFAQLWETVLRESHTQAIAVLQDDPDAILELGDDGTLSIRLETVIAEVKDVLTEQGFGFASSIPEIERSIPIVQADELSGVRAAYQAAVTTGYVLPWVLLVALIAGVALAKRRMRALAWTGAGLAVSFLTLAAGVGVGRWYFMNSMSPSIMPSRTAGVMFDHVTTSISSVLTALVILTVIIMIGAWFAGSSKAARGIRGALDSGFGAARRSLDRHGLHTGAIGRFAERWHRPLMVVIALIALIILLMIRPVTAPSVSVTVLVVLLLFVVLELVRRPESPGHRDLADTVVESEALSEASESELDEAASAQTNAP